MSFLPPSAPLTAADFDVQPAHLADRAALYALSEHHHRVHFNLDWWAFDNWLYSDRPSDAIWLARRDGQLAGALLAPFDDGPTVWLRMLAIANGYLADPIATALLHHARPALHQRGAQQLAVLAHPDWLVGVLPRLNFTPATEVVTFRKSERTWPVPPRLPGLIIRDATFDDVPAITLNDRAAFAPLWWHSAVSIDHILRSVSHFVVAQLDDRVVGHAFSDVYGGQGHLIRLVVHPDLQGRRIGEQLLAESLAYQLHANAYPFTLNTQIENRSSQSLYRRYGYREVGRPVKVLTRELRAV